MVEPQLPKLMMWVRFPSPAPIWIGNETDKNFKERFKFSKEGDFVLDWARD